MMDLLTEPEIADAILGHLFDYHYRVNKRMFEIAGDKVDLTWIAEDLGAQTGLLMGLEQIRRFILPYQKKMGDLGRREPDGCLDREILERTYGTGLQVMVHDRECPTCEDESDE